MTKALSTILAGIFFFSSMTGMGQWSIVSTAQAKSFDLDDEEEDFEEEPAEEEPVKEEKPAKSAGDDELDDIEDIDALIEDKPAEKPAEKPAPKDDIDDLDGDDSGAVASASGSITVLYYFADSTAEKKAKDIARTIGTYLKELPNYRFFGTDARVFNDLSYDKLADDIARAEKYLEEGKSFNDDADPDSAIGKLTAALDLLEKRIDVMHDHSLLTKILFQVGATWTLLEEETKAKEAFSKALALNPDYEADEGTDDDTIDFFDKIKSNLMMQPLGDLRITTEPAGATVYIDGRIVGMTPAKIEGLTAGKHYWRIHKTGYRDAGGIVSIYDGAEAKLDETLSTGTGAAEIEPLEKLAQKDFGGAEMMKKAVEVGKAAKVARLMAIHAAVEEAEEGTLLKLQIKLLNPDKASFKEESVSFSLPGNGDLTRSEDLRTALDNLFADEYGFNPVSSIVSGSLSTGGGGGGDDDSVVNKWWFWTIIGVLVAGAAGGGAAAGILLSEPSKKSGATMTIQFGN